MKINAYAKINATLDICGVREDGFHSLRSVMLPVSLHDEIVIEKSESLSFQCNIKELCTEDNLCLRAARLFFESTGIDGAVAIELEKNIPFPAGLGGGSADAAAVLKGVNTLFDKPLDDTGLLTLASKLGSDVSFCLYGSPALCEGRGELLTPIDGIPELYLVIAIGKARLSTPAVYRKYDEAGLEARNDSDRFLKAIESRDRDAIVASFGNAFEPVTDLLAPETMELRSRMISLGAQNARLSGSGPSVFGVLKSYEEARICAQQLEGMGYFAISCRTLDKTY